jgi:hypothetical protein
MGKDNKGITVDIAKAADVARIAEKITIDQYATMILSAKERADAAAIIGKAKGDGYSVKDITDAVKELRGAQEAEKQAALQAEREAAAMLNDLFTPVYEARHHITDGVVEASGLVRTIWALEFKGKACSVDMLAARTAEVISTWPTAKKFGRNRGISYKDIRKRTAEICLNGDGNAVLKSGNDINKVIGTKTLRLVQLYQPSFAL